MGVGRNHTNYTMNKATNITENAPGKRPTRTETDSMGAVEVPAEVYWGAQTARSVPNFRIGHDVMPSEVVHALAMVKRAAAEVNCDLKLLHDDLAKFIVEAAKEVISGA